MDDDLLDTPEATAALEKLKKSQHAQKEAISKVKEAEDYYLTCLTKIAANLQLSEKWYALSKTQAALATMSMIRAISKPTER
jgi:hypothetical protein